MVVGLAQAALQFRSFTGCMGVRDAPGTKVFENREHGLCVAGSFGLFWSFLARFICGPF